MLNPVYPETSQSKQQLGKVKLCLPKLSTVHIAIKQCSAYPKIYTLKDENANLIEGHFLAYKLIKLDFDRYRALIIKTRTRNSKKEFQTLDQS